MLDTTWKPPILETPRMIMRPLDERDAGDIFLYCSNPRMTSFTLWNTHETIDDSLMFLREYSFSRYSNKEPDPIGVVLKNDPTRSVVGTVGCFWSSKKDGVMELGYNLAEPYWGRGLIVEAAQALVDYVFREFAVERIQARVLHGNSASARVARKLGLTHEGTLKSMLLLRGARVDVEFYAILRSEWSRRPV